MFTFVPPSSYFDLWPPLFGRSLCWLLKSSQNIVLNGAHLLIWAVVEWGRQQSMHRCPTEPFYNSVRKTAFVMAQPCVTSCPPPRAHIAFAVLLVPTAETEEIEFHITETVESRQSTDSISGGPDVLGCLLPWLSQGMQGTLVTLCLCQLESYTMAQ